MMDFNIKWTTWNIKRTLKTDLGFLDLRNIANFFAKKSKFDPKNPKKP